jgi:hypothetical protein
MKIRMQHSIASREWSYHHGEVLTAGEKYGPGEVPATVARTWLSSGLAAAVEEQPIETAALKRKR